MIQLTGNVQLLSNHVVMLVLAFLTPLKPKLIRSVHQHSKAQEIYSSQSSSACVSESRLILLSHLRKYLIGYNSTTLKQPAALQQCKAYCPVYSKSEIAFPVNLK